LPASATRGAASRHTTAPIGLHPNALKSGVPRHLIKFAGKK